MSIPAWVRRWTRRALKLALLLALVATAGLGLLVGIVQTGSFRRWATEEARSRLPAEPSATRVQIGAITRLSPWGLDLEWIEILDAGGPWLRIESPTLELEPSGLLEGRLVIERLGAPRIAVSRLPEGEDGPASGPPALPELPLAIEVRRCELSRIELGERVMPGSALLALEGSFDLDALPRGASIHLELRRQDASRTRLSVEGRLSGSHPVLTLNAALEEAPGGVIGALLGLAPDAEVRGELEGSGPLDGWKGNAALILEGLVTGRLRVAIERDESGWTIGARGTAGELTVRPAAPGGAPLELGPVELEASTRFDATSLLTLDRVQVKARQLELGLRGAASLAEGHGEIDASLRVPDLAALAPFLGEQSLAGSLEATGSAGWAPLVGLRWDAGVAARDLRVGGFASPLTTAALESSPIPIDPSAPPVPILSGNGASLAPSWNATTLAGQETLAWSFRGMRPGTGSVSVDTLTASFGPLEIRAAGSSRYDGSRFEGAAEVLVSDLSRLPGLSETEKGIRVTSRVDVKGSASGPRATVRLFGRAALPAGLSGPLASLAGRELPFRGDLEVSARDDSIALPLQLELVGGSVKGALEMERMTHRVSGSLEGKFDDLATVAGLAGVDLTGSADLSLLLDPREAPGTLTLEIKGSKLALDGRTVEEVRLKGSARSSDVAGTAEGVLAVAGVTAGGVVLSRVDGTLRAEDGGLRLDVTVTGSAEALPGRTVELTLAGTGRRSEAGTVVRVVTAEGLLGFDRLRLDAPLELTLRGDDLRLEGGPARLGPARVSASGRLSAVSIQARAEVSEAPAGWALRAYQPDAVGTVTGSVELEGSPRQPRARFALRVEDLAVPEAEARGLPKARIELEGTADARQLSATASLAGITEKPARGSVTMPIDWSLAPFRMELPETGELTGSLEAAADLARIASFLALDLQQLAGALDCDIRIGGTAAAPRVSGGVEVRDGSYVNGRTGTVLSSIALKMGFEGKRLAVEQLSATDGGSGRLGGSGWIDFGDEEGVPLGVRLELVGMQLVRRDDLRMTCAGSAILTGTLLAPRLEGDLVMGPAHFRIPERLPPDVASLEVIEVHAGEDPFEVEAAELEAGFPERLELDVKLRAPRGVFVRGRGLESEWKADLRVGGWGDRPQVTGSLSVVKGHLSFAGQRATISRGTIAFAGSYPVDPELDILAESRIRGIMAQIAVAGSPTIPLVELTSDPVMPQDEIISRILFGRSATNISPAQALQVGSLLQTLAEGGADRAGLFGSARDALGVDTLGISEEDSGRTLGLGKYLDEGVFVEIQQGLGSNAGRKVSVEAEVSPGLTVEGFTVESSVDAQQRSGVGLNWRRDY